MARWAQRVIYEYWELITAIGWACIITGIVFSCYLVANLTDSMNSLGNQLKAVKRFSLIMEGMAKQNKMHLQAQTARMDVIEQRLEALEPKNKEKARKAALKGERIIYREYILTPITPPKNADRPKKAD